MSESAVSRSPVPRIGVIVAILAVTLACLYPVSRVNYLAFHSFVEMFSAVALASVFVVAWNTRRFVENPYLLAVGISALFVAIVTAAHLLSYRGMNVFPVPGANLATQLWIISRALAAAGFLTAGVALRHRISARIMGGAFTVVTVVALLSVSVWPVFPAMYVEGSGLTATKIALEYVVVGALGASLWLLWRDRQCFTPHVLRLLSAAIVLLIAGELSFTLYADVYGVMNFLGHCFAAIAILLVYFAMVEGSLRRPYESLFLELKREQEQERLLADDLEFLASHDALTGLLNRRAFDQEIARAGAHVARGAACSLLFADIDRLKRCNDLLGHEIGDAVLREVSAALRRELREVDVIARIGGDEFGVILWDRDTKDIKSVQQRLDAAVNAAGSGLGCDVGLSTGVVAIRPDDTPRDIVALADARMYEDKRSRPQ